MYSWVCYDALQWKPSLIMPDHVREILDQRTQDDIETSILKAKLYMDAVNLTKFQQAEAHRELATGYWLNAFFQDSRKKQFAFLKLSINELETLQEIDPDRKQVNGWLADVYHIMGEYAIADNYYKEARKYFPDNRFFRDRHQEMQSKWERIKELEELENS
jgi:tetratricopeptide (TPR) repeat protein